MKSVESLISTFLFKLLKKEKIVWTFWSPTFETWRREWRNSKNLHRELVDTDFEEDENQVIQQLLEQDAELLATYEDVKLEVTEAIVQIKRQTERQAQVAPPAAPPILPVAAPVAVPVVQAAAHAAQVPAHFQINRAPAPQIMVKLPKIELKKFSGDVIHFQEFWDMFESSVHNNPSLSGVQKMTYLKSMLEGNARRAISGLSSTNENYDAAVATIRYRFGNDQVRIDSLYSKLTALAPASNQLDSLRNVIDSLEQNFNALDALGENVDHRHFTSMIKSKLQSEVLLRLEEQRGGADWSVSDLRENLLRHLMARELSDRPQASNHSKPKNTNSLGPNSSGPKHQSTAGALISGDKNGKEKSEVKCAFCQKGHYSDQCKTFPTMETRKEKIKGHCFNCFRKDHGVRDCRSTTKCFHCKMVGNHHRSLCPSKFGHSGGNALIASDSGANGAGGVQLGSNLVSISASSTGTLMAHEDLVHLQTAKTVIGSINNSKTAPAQILLDPGSHRTYITAKLAKELNLKCQTGGKVHVFTFATNQTKDINTSFTVLRIKLIDGTWMQLKAIVIPMITENNLATFRFTRVPFGIISSPFLLAATVSHHLRKAGSPTALKVLRDIYVDNVLTGASSDEKAIAMGKEMIDLFGTASINLQEWNSNSKHFLEQIPAASRSLAPGNLLGVPWNPEKDTISVSTAGQYDFSKGVTKRQILHFSASFFDPMGLLSPVIITMRKFLQSLWDKKYDWDQSLPQELQDEWRRIMEENSVTVPLTLPRYVGTTDEDFQVELHVFCDASKYAYGACIYLRICDKDGIHSSLMFSKARLAPLRGEFSIPRLELLAVCIGAKCIEFVSLNLPFHISRKVVWSDSQCVLYWLRSKKTLTTFVKTLKSKVKTLKSKPRVETLKHYQGLEFRYVPTMDNPADIASRGCSYQEIVGHDLWWNGPQWLSANEPEWPSQISFIQSSFHQQCESEEQIESCVMAAPKGAIADSGIASVIDCGQYSSLSKLLWVTAWVNRFIKGVRKEARSTTKSLSTEEISMAKELWIKSVQQRNFRDAIESIERKQRHPLVDALGLRIDQQGLLRCSSRLDNSELSELAISPILLPKNDLFTTMVIQAHHRKLLHVGVSHTLANLRNEYWIPAGRMTVSKVIHACPQCKRFDGGPYKLPPMPPLPKSRVTPTKSFTATGLDYFGPLFVKGQEGSRKAWVCLFTCLSTRAIHLELVDDLSTEHFLYALQCFISRRGKPALIISDNALQFKRAKSLLEKFSMQLPHDPCVSSYSSENGISWSFITERAPWKGGFYERLIRLVKQCLKKSLGSICLTAVQLQTMLTEIEAILNSRPLVYVGADFSSGQLITPNHFLSLNEKTGTPILDRNKLQSDIVAQRVSSKDQVLENWKRGNQHLETFWKLWRNEYLLSLSERRQMHVSQPHCRATEKPTVGDVVLVRNEGPRGTWKLARISKLNAESDGNIRSVEIKFANGNTTNRSLMHLYPLECQNDDEILSHAQIDPNLMDEDPE